MRRLGYRNMRYFQLHNSMLVKLQLAEAVILLSSHINVNISTNPADAVHDAAGAAYHGTGMAQKLKSVVFTPLLSAGQLLLLASVNAPAYHYPETTRHSLSLTLTTSRTSLQPSTIEDSSVPTWPSVTLDGCSRSMVLTS